MAWTLKSSVIRCAGLAVLITLLAGFSAAAAETSGGATGLTLAEAYHIALKHNAVVMQSVQQLNQAQADVKIATSPLLPQVSLTAEAVRQKSLGVFGPKHYSDVGVSLSQSIYKGGQYYHDRSASQYAATGQEYSLYRTRQEILYAVATHFYNALLARRSVEIAQNQLIRAQRQLQLAEQRQTVGLVSKTAVLRARVQVAAAKEAIEQAKNQHVVALERLALEMGVNQAPVSLVEPEEMKWHAKSINDYITEALANRQDLKSAKDSVKAAEERIKAQKANFIPSLALTGSYTRANSNDHFYGANHFWEIGLHASYPLFTGFRDREEVFKALAAKRQADAALLRLKQEVRVAVRSAYADVQTQQKLIKNLTDQVNSARANYQQVTAEFEEGVSSAVDVVDAQTALNEAELQLANAYYQYQLDQLNLKVAEGTFGEKLLGDEK